MAKTVSQMEAVLLDRIKQSQLKLEKLQTKHKIEIGTLAYKHHLNHLTLEEFDMAFTELAWKKLHDSKEN